MTTTSTASTFESFTLKALLRKDSIDRLVLAFKIIFACICLLFLAAVVAQGVRYFLNSRTDVSKLEEQVAAMLTKAEVVVNPSPVNNDYTAIATKNIFERTQAKTTTSKPVPKKSDASLTLIGTHVSTGEAPQAIIEHKSKKTQDVFEVNDMVFGEAKLVTILVNRVEIERNQKIEILTLDDTPDSSRTGGTVDGAQEIAVDEGELNSALEDLPLLLTQARAVPYFKDGKSVGLRLFAIKNGSLYQKIGLRNGDILQTLNGNNLGDISQAMKLFEKLKEERSITLVVERAKQQKTFHYTIQ
ncbi:hypothetical protein OAO01_05570 [Oligoflexia bacterium]|nr:hypothetical protein [Oligoflexia bacterium]